MATATYGDQVEHILIAGQWRDAIVVYAADLGRARAVASSLRAAGHPLILIDVHATVAESLAVWRAAQAESLGIGVQNRLSYSGTIAGLKSYITDLALMRIADGAIVSVDECAVENRGTPGRDITDLALAEFNDRFAPV